MKYEIESYVFDNFSPSWVFRLKIERQLKKDKKKKGKKEKWNTKAASTVADDSPPGSPGVDLEDEEQTPRPQRKVETNEKSMKMNAIQRLKDERERKKQNGQSSHLVTLAVCNRYQS